MHRDRLADRLMTAGQAGRHTDRKTDKNKNVRDRQRQKTIVNLINLNQRTSIN